MVRKDLLKQDFLAGKPITLPILDGQCLRFFFEPDDILFKKLDNIASITFLYVPENDGYCPVIKCTINYTHMCLNINNIPSDNQYFIYDEIDDAICLSQFQNRIENFINYLDLWVSTIYKQRIARGEKGLEIKRLLDFMKSIGCMGHYLIQYEEIVAELDHNFVITDKRFT